MSPTVSERRPSRRALAFGVLGSVVSLTIVVILWLQLGFTTRVDGNVHRFAYVVVAAILLGFVPTVLLVSRRLVTPLLTVVTLGVASAYRTWAVYVDLDIAPTSVDQTPFGWFLVGCIAVLGLARVIGEIEHRLRASADLSNAVD